MCATVYSTWHLASLKSYLYQYRYYQYKVYLVIHACAQRKFACMHAQLLIGTATSYYHTCIVVACICK